MSGLVLMVHALGGMRGPARTLASLAPRVAESWDVDVAAPEGFVLASLEGVPSIRVCLLPIHGSRPRSWTAGSTRIRSFVHRGPVPDVIHANGLSALNLAAPAALEKRIPIFVHFHGSETGRRARTLAKLWGQLGLRLSLHPVSEQSRHVLTTAGLGSIVGATLPNPVSIPPELRVVRREGAIRVGFVGSASRQKGLHLLVDIAQRLKAEPVSWLVFGVDPASASDYVRVCRERLVEAGIGERVEWRGVVRDVEAAYREMDVLLVPSLRESWCRVVMEGMAAGLPVVGTDIAGMSELFERVPDALTFAVDRPDVAAKHLRNLVADPALRSALGATGREAMRAFELEAVTSRLLDLYEQLLSRIRRRAALPTI